MAGGTGRQTNTAQIAAYRGRSTQHRHQKKAGIGEGASVYVAGLNAKEGKGVADQIMAV